MTMLVKYNNKYYHTGFPKAIMDIWKFESEEGFVAQTKKNSLFANKEVTTYHKEIPITEVDAIFALFFYVVWDDKKFTANLSQDGNVDIFLAEKEKDYALANMFEMNMDFSAWQKTIPLDECSEFFMTKMIVYPKDVDEEISLSKEDWVKYNQMVIEENKKGC
jgi:hypothetical protein